MGAGAGGAGSVNPVTQERADALERVLGRADRLAHALDALQQLTGANEWNAAAARVRATRAQLAAERVAGEKTSNKRAKREKGEDE